MGGLQVERGGGERKREDWRMGFRVVILKIGGWSENIVSVERKFERACFQDLEECYSRKWNGVLKLCY